ncbi:MAG: hypothetical protein U9N61_00210 [Euryarchaeota archaeon]|nr:hypothetical protein [Euryarchaeota archaeon]
MQELKIISTDIYHIDLESLKALAANPEANVEIQSNGDVYICIES